MLSVAKSGWLNREGIHETSIVRWIGGAERKVNEKIVLLSFITHSSSCKHFILMLTVFEHQASLLISFSSAYPWGSQGVLPHFIPLFQGVAGFLEPRVHPGWVTSSSQGPYWWQRQPHKVPTAHEKQFWGSVSCSRILWHVAQFCPRGSCIRTSD